MNFNEYQKKALSTAIFPADKAVPYLALGLVGEAGEVAEKIKKIIRDKNGVILQSDAEAIMKEMGDVLWYLSVLANEIGFLFSEVAEENIEKLFSRKSRSMISGEGDDR